MLAISFSCLLNDNLIQLLNNSKENKIFILHIDQIIHLVLRNEWNRAKSIWILKVLELEPSRNKICTYGQEFDFFIRYVK